MTRDVLLVGSVPLRPAEKVFEAVARELGGLVPRIPDGDQRGWVYAVFEAFAENGALEQVRRLELNPGGVDVPIFRLRGDLTPADIELGPYGYAETASDSYADFRSLRDSGVIAAGTRFQVTMPGPITSACSIQLPAEQLLPLAREALDDEVQRLVASIPAGDLAVQFDIAIEVEHEEYRRSPDVFDTAIHETFDWTQAEMADSVAWLANRVPSEVEVGFHLCSMWHHYQAGGQDNTVLVEVANEIRARMDRPLNYVHIPTIPEHGEADFEPLRDLKLDRDTALYLGVIHAGDGLEGALRRVAAAQTAVPDFGIAAFCGLAVVLRLGRDPASRNDTAVAQMLALHRDVATHTTQ